MGSKVQHLALWNCSFSHKQISIAPEEKSAHPLMRKPQSPGFRANTKAPSALSLGSGFPIKLQGDSFCLLPAHSFLQESTLLTIQASLQHRRSLCALQIKGRDNYQDAQEATPHYSLKAAVDTQRLTHLLMSKPRQNISGNKGCHHSFFSPLSHLTNLMPPSQHFMEL